MSDRLVQLEGAMNFRDLGGYQGLDGRTVRWGCVFRSDALHELTKGDIETVRALGLRAIYDLRRSVERQRQPTVIPEDHGHRTVHLSVGDDPDDANQPDMIDLILAGELKEADDAFMTEVYISMVTEGAPAFGRLLTHLTDDDGLPALFHCAAGKDRTGLAAAFLLSVLGVDEDVILDDYELSTQFRSEKRIAALRPQLEAAGIDIEKVRPFLSARRPVMEATLHFINEEYGGVEPYLRGPAHMSAATIATLRDRLLEP